VISMGTAASPDFLLDLSLILYSPVTWHLKTSAIIVALTANSHQSENFVSVAETPRPTNTVECQGNLADFKFRHIRRSCDVSH